MTLWTPEPLTSWDRHLPTPAALLHRVPSGGLDKSQPSFHPHVVSAPAPKTLFNDVIWRHNSVPCISLERGRVEAAQQADVIDLTVPIAARAISIHHPRKRSASIMTGESTSRERTPSTPSTGDSTQQFCLCQPDPKIPRPRNAFILYRQHQQAAVAAQNPGLPNPDISKIIGEQWRSLPAKSKNEWKALAEEEKARHQQQYPDYRYQPRRNGRYSNRSSVSAGPSPTTATSAQGTCLKCGGKMMNPPTTPYTAYPPTAARVQQQMVGMPPPQRSYIMNNAPPLVRSRVNGSMASLPPSARARPYPEVFSRTQAIHDPRIRYPQTALQESTPLSPDPKRRRFNGNGVFTPIREHAPLDTYQYSPRMIPVSHYDAVPQQQQHHPQPIIRPMYAAPPPPPQLQPVRPRRPASTQHQHPHDPNLTLPPLKSITSPNHPPQTTQQPEPRKTSTTSTASTAPSQMATGHSGLAAMIHSIPVVSKLKILRQISPPLHTSGPSSPVQDVRGAIVAIEGPDHDCVSEMTKALEGMLRRSGFAVRVFRGPATDIKETSAQAFLGLIGQWHAISREVVDFITTKPEEVSGQKDVVMDEESPGDAEMAQEDSVVVEVEVENDAPMRGATDTDTRADSEAISPKTMTKAAALSLTSPAPNTTTFPTTPSHSHSVTSRPPLPPPGLSKPKPHQSSSLIPIALIPHYQLSTVDAASTAMPITDAYSPLSHWQWLATLWRGCVGADVSVVIEQSATAPGEREEKSADIGVEVRLRDAGAVVVRVTGTAGTRGEEEKQKDGGEGWEKAVRRVGFEVDEFLRK